MTHNRSNRRGAILPMLAFVMAAILIVVALTINTNWFLYNQINAQNAADLSARSSLVSILGDIDPDGRVDRSRELGARLYNLNLDRPDVNVDPDRIQFGRIVDPSAAEPQFEQLGDNDLVSAVFVDTPVEHQEVDVFLANVLGGPDRVRIVADATVSTTTVDVMLCLDGSRSMNRESSSFRGLPPGANTIHEPPMPGSRWFELRSAVALFLEALAQTNPNARIGLATFGGGKVAADEGKPFSPLDEFFVRLEQDLVPVIGAEARGIPDILESYSTDFPMLGLGTSLFDGMQTCRASLADDPNATRHIILLSDGLQATNNTRPEPIIAATAADNDGIIIHTISFGGDFAVLEEISELTGGSNFTAQSEEELREAFAQLLGRFRVQLVD